ncbi:MAG TPA: P-loop NTPase fold protein [Anaerolineales bacterium]|nr:P-loop NTPase fold protein [Anaerolineales bacterium]
MSEAPREKAQEFESNQMSQSAPPPPMPSYASGVDVSEQQRVVDWKRVVGSGVSFAFIKASHAEQTDSMFAEHWNAAKEAGLLRGAVHYFSDDIDPAIQASAFLQQVNDILNNNTGELPPALDLSLLASVPTVSASNVKLWLDTVEGVLGKRPILFCDPSVLQSRFVDEATKQPLSWVSEYPLWVKQYPTVFSYDMQPSLPYGWHEWKFWQYTNQGQVDGVDGDVGQSYFNSSFEGLREFVRSVAPRQQLNFALNDRPQGPDRLSYERYADAFAQVLSGQYTQTPLTVGIYAAWGMGKSFLLGKVKDKLKVIEKNDNRLNFAFIDFNAWVYSGSENLWAGLVTTLYEGIEKHYKTKGGERMVQEYRRKEAWAQLWNTFRKSLRLVIFFSIPAILLSIFMDYQSIQTGWKTFVDAILLILGGAPLLTKLPDLLVGVKTLVDSLVLLRSKQLAELTSRKDFKDKVGFMADIQAELRHISDSIKELDAKNKQKTRFVIFVDDLDRCPPGKAVEVLEAIMLLLSDRTEDPFVIFLAMDARVLVKAIEKRYGEVLTEAGVSGYEFLDKIVQIPFRIPPADTEDIKGYVRSLLYQSPDAMEKALNARVEVDVPDIDTVLQNAAGGASQPQRGQGSEKTASRSRGGNEATQQVQEKLPEEEPFRREEESAFESFSPFLSRNPRRVKRIVNIYRLARILLTREIKVEVAIKWVMLTEQWPFRIAWVMQKIEDDIQLGREVSLNAPLAEIYEQVRGFVQDEKSHKLALLDENPEVFEAFIQQEPLITVADIDKLWGVTFNLNPAMQNEVLKSAVQVNGKE